MTDLIALVMQYFEIYGYYALFFALLFENLILLGLIVPGETILILASALTATSATLKIQTVIVTASSAAIIGQVCGYFMGKYGGEAFVLRLGEKFHISKDRIIDAEKYFQAHGGKTVIIGRFATGIRVFIPLIAGFSKMPFPKFVVYTIIAVLAWTTTLGTAGFLLGDNIDLILLTVKKIGFVFAGIIATVIGTFIFIRKRSAEKRRMDAESK